MKVYRSGAVEVCDHTGSVEHDVYDYADKRRPRGFPSRSNSIYASPALAGVVRWVRGRRWNPRNPDLKVREITVADTALVFNVRAWERASDEIADSSYGNSNDHSVSKADAAVADYWNSAMTLADFAASDLDPSEWELLIPADGVISSRNVSARRVLSVINDDCTRSEVKSLLR